VAAPLHAAPSQRAAGLVGLPARRSPLGCLCSPLNTRGPPCIENPSSGYRWGSTGRGRVARLRGTPSGGYRWRFNKQESKKGTGGLGHHWLAARAEHAGGVTTPHEEVRGARTTAVWPL
jgi:hypothetical protein